MVATGSEFARPVGWRLFVTVWLVYSIFATTNVVRETYLAMSLAERGSVRVDPYRELHPDLFQMPGRGWYINGNPGTSILAAVPYALFVRPLIALATKIRPDIVASKPPATYDDPRPNRTLFMNAARARGLDIVLGLAALGTGVTFMAPMGALATVLVFMFLRGRLGSDRRALAWALVFAFATPTVFRAAFLNHNLLLAYLILGAWILNVGLSPRAPETAPDWRTLVGIGVLLGYGLVCDYSAIPFLLVFGIWILVDGWRRGGIAIAVRNGAFYTAGAVSCFLILFGYQWVALGHPLWPAQRYMPATELSARGWLGFTVPSLELVWRLLFDLRYGLFAFSPLLTAALAAPFIQTPPGWSLSRAQLGWGVGAFLALLLFGSANQFSILQWNTGVRYMMPAAPLLFVCAVPVLIALPRVARWSLVGVSMVITVAVTMTRESVPTALRLVAADGPTLPVLTALRKMGSAYAVPVSGWTFWLAALAVGGVLVLVWRPALRRATAI